MASRQGPTLSIFIMIGIGLVVGTAAGAIFEGFGLGGRVVALISGALAVLIASLARFKLMSGLAQGGNEGKRIGTMTVFGVIAVIAGSLSGHDIYTGMDARMPLILGAVAGLLSTTVMSVAMITLHENLSNG